MKNIKILAKKFTVDFFRNNCEDLFHKLTEESNKIYNSYDQFRTKFYDE